MGNVEAHDFAPVRADERTVLNLGRKVTPKQYVRHLNGQPHDACLTELPWSVRDSVCLYEKMTVAFNAITEIPVELPLRLPHLSSLDLNHNQIAALPESFGLFFHLKEIQLQHNKLSSLPESFIHLVKLEKIDLSYNELRSLPKDMGKMESMKKLNVVHNKLVDLPISLGSPSCPINVLLAQQNRSETPSQAICDEGSQAVLQCLRKMHSFIKPEVKPPPVNLFPRCCSNRPEKTVSNPHSAQIQYIQEQTNTLHTTNKIKAPLLPPPDASSHSPFVLQDKIIGLIYGAAIGDAIGLSCSWMSDDEVVFHYGTDQEEDELTYENIAQDEHRVLWRQGDWTSNFDQFMLVLESAVSWGGVVDELEFARRLKGWVLQGFSELGDTSGVLTSSTLQQVIHHPSFTKEPHTTANLIFRQLQIHVTNGTGLSSPNSHPSPQSNHIPTPPSTPEKLISSSAQIQTTSCMQTEPQISPQSTQDSTTVSTTNKTSISPISNDTLTPPHSPDSKTEDQKQSSSPSHNPTSIQAQIVNQTTPNLTKSTITESYPSSRPKGLHRLSSSSSLLSNLSICSHVEVAQKLVDTMPSSSDTDDNTPVVRTPILGVPNFHDPKEVEENALRICRTTHANPKCVASCVLVSSIISLLLQGRISTSKPISCGSSGDDLLSSVFSRAAAYLSNDAEREEFCSLKEWADISRFDARQPGRMRQAYKLVEVAIIALKWDGSFKALLNRLVRMGGDSSTNACMAGAVMGCRVGYSQLPVSWLTGLRKKQVTWLNTKINHLLDVMGSP